jgi:hypothetical protein
MTLWGGEIIARRLTCATQAYDFHLRTAAIFGAFQAIFASPVSLRNEVKVRPSFDNELAPFL